MKKLFVLVAIACVAWLLKLSFDMYMLSDQQTALQLQQAKLEQRNALLNDQLASIKRQSGGESTTVEQVQPESPMQAVGIQPAVIISNQLDFIEFALQQQQYGTALEKMNVLEQNLADYALSPALKESLSQAIDTDRQNVSQYVKARNEQQQKIAVALGQLDDVIAKEIKQQHLNLPVQHEQSFWKRWLQIESVEQPSTVLMQRPLILKEAQLRLLNCQQLLQKGQYVIFQQEISQVEVILKQLPDSNTQHFIQQIQYLKNLPVLNAPVLNTRALIG